MVNSPSVVAYANRVAGPYAVRVDEVTDDYAIVAVGENMPEHFTVGLTLKVLRNGTVYVCDIMSTDDDQWRIDDWNGNAKPVR